MSQTHRRASTFLFRVMIEMGSASYFSAAGNALDVVLKKEKKEKIAKGNTKAAKMKF